MGQCVCRRIGTQHASQKSEDNYALCHADDLQLRLASFERWLQNQTSTPDNALFEMDVCEATELPDPNAGLKETAQFRRHAGETIKAIAEDLELHPSTVSKWCEGIKPPSPAQAEVLDILSDGEVWKKADIEKHSRFAGQNVRIALTTLLDAGQICKPKRGYYQRNMS